MSAVVAAGKWELEQPSKHASGAGGVRYMQPRCSGNEVPAKPYTSLTFAAFTGLSDYPVGQALSIIDSVEGKGKGENALPKGVVTQAVSRVELADEVERLKLIEEQERERFAAFARNLRPFDPFEAAP